MNVLWITSAYPSEEQPGSGVFHETQVQALRRLGMNITVICPVPQNPAMLQYLKKTYRSRCDIPPVYQRNGVTVYRPHYLALPGQLRWSQPDQRIAAAVLDVMDRSGLMPDVLHAHFAMPSGGAARIVAEKKQLPWLLTLHGSDVNVYPHFSKSAMRAFVQTIGAADEVLSVGESLREKTREMTGRDSVVLPIGIDLSRFKEPKKDKLAIRRKLGLPLDKKMMVFVGRLTEAKGIFELLQAIERLPDETACVFVGDGPSAEKIKAHSEFNRRIFAPGQMENERVKDYLSASDLFVLPSHTEGMPTVVIEALALKIPAVCTEVGSLPELFGNYRDLLVEPKSVDSLTQRILDYLYRELPVQEIGRDLRRQVELHYDAGQNAAALREAYHHVLDRALLIV
ncbi:teichuronic acid biosynthesis protein TuaC [Peribacillus kribbensis]|uniref:teichuronic acid biosynthesis protein TuaC n=1 Tax=Peribacillus kribbensis TaxID=356658 RepID=UPI00041C5DF3|nr:glycosyltransferase [Peribacillus kribbensis]